MTYVKSLVSLGKRPKTKSEKKHFYEYFEFHHIVPKSIGGDDSPDNVVPLTAREHVLAHLTLCDIYTDKDAHFKMLNALQRLIGTRESIENRYSDKLISLCNSRAIAAKLEERAKEQSIRMTGFKFGQAFIDKQVSIQSNRNKDWCKHISEAKKGNLNPSFGKKWFTNGTDSIMADKCPEGYWPGRLCIVKNYAFRPILNEDNNDVYDGNRDAEEKLGIPGRRVIQHLATPHVYRDLGNLRYFYEEIKVFPDDVIELAKKREKSNASMFKKFEDLEIDRFVTTETIQKFKNFPYESYTFRELKHDWELLYNSDSAFKNGNKIIGQYHRSIYENNCNNRPSPKEAWKDKLIMKKLIANRSMYLEKDTLNAKDLRRGLTVIKLAPHPSVFQPAYAKALVKEFLNDCQTVFDPFSGYSGRMLGAISCDKNYIGQDIDLNHVNESKSIIGFLKALKVKFNADISVKDVDDSYGEYECLFTCPPYNLKEVWGTELKDRSCDEWIDICLNNFKCKKYLFVVDKTEKYSNFVVNIKYNKSHFSNAKEKIIYIER